MISRLINWLAEGNASISSNIEIKEIPGQGRSVICKQEINAGSQILLVRRKQLLNKQTIKTTFSKWTPQWNNLNSHQQLALVISLYRNDPACYWYPFLSLLPTSKDFVDVPLTMDDNQLAGMPASVLKHVSKQKAIFLSDFEKVNSILPKEDNIPLDQFLESWLCVNSRCLYMKLTGTDGTASDNMTMAPFIDFLNHTVGDNTSVKVDITAMGMIVTAKKKYHPGEEIFLGYGPHDNTFLQCEYGFSLPENPWDSLDISEDVLNLLTEWHKTILKQLGYFNDYTIGLDGPSFRTEIALACSQEVPNTSNSIPNSLRSFCDGITDGIKYQAGNTKLLKTILLEQQNKLHLLQQNNITKGYENIIIKYLKTNA